MMHLQGLKTLFSRKKYITPLTSICVSAALVSVAGGSSAIYPPQINNAPELEANLTLENLVKHLRAFQNHADQSNVPGTRFMGTSGYEASTNYVVDLLKSAGYNVTVQTVPVTLTYITKPRVFEQVGPNSKVFADDVDYAPFIGSGEGDVTADVEPLTNSTGCKSTDFAHFIKGNIALLTEGICDISTKINNAAAAGAKAVIVANSTPGIFYIGLTPTPAENIPSLLVSSDVAKSFVDASKTGTLSKLHIKFNAVRMKTESKNIIAESKGGDPNHVVMVGAHLDSSVGNAGMNDNASSSATILEIALLMQNTNPVNKLRFAWWTGEEMGLLGSNYYVEHLNNVEKSKIAAYLNYEILGAPNGARLIMGPEKGVTPPGSEKITQTYAKYFEQHGLKYFVFDPSMQNAGIRSDMYAFMQANIPVGYLVSGADIPWMPLLSSIFSDLPNRKDGVFMHPCYHKLCDKLSMTTELQDPNFDFDLYLQMSKAAAFAVYTYAMNLNN